MLYINKLFASGEFAGDISSTRIGPLEAQSSMQNTPSCAHQSQIHVLDDAKWMIRELKAVIGVKKCCDPFSEKSPVRVSSPFQPMPQCNVCSVSPRRNHSKCHCYFCVPVHTPPVAFVFWQCPLPENLQIYSLNLFIKAMIMISRRTT